MSILGNAKKKLEKFIIEETEERIVGHGGLSLIGSLLARTLLGRRLNQQVIPQSPNPEISHGDVAISFIGLLAQGKSDFENIEAYREDDFFAASLGIKDIPSSPTLRQRLDQAAGQAGFEDILLEESANLLHTMQVSPTPVSTDKGPLVPLDIDVSPFDNSRTKKEGIAMTYKKVVGYAPIFAYLGQEGYLVNLELRTGSQHSQKDTPEFLKKTLDYCQRITPQGILVRLDSGNDSKENFPILRGNDDHSKNVDFIIKHNLRREAPESYLDLAQKEGEKTETREGKSRFVGSKEVLVEDKPVRLVYEVILRESDHKGQILLTPDLEVNTFWTSVSDHPERIITLYHEHGTMEQFHSELKTDLNLERLPSGKMATNRLVLHLSLLAYNLLRMIGQESLKKQDTPLKAKVSRRRIRTVILNLIHIAIKCTRHSRRWVLKIDRRNPWRHAWQRLYTAWA